MVDKTRRRENTITITLLGTRRKLRIPSTQNRDDIPAPFYASDEFLYRPAPDHNRGVAVKRGTASRPHAAQFRLDQTRRRQFHNLHLVMLWLIMSALVYCALTHLPVSPWRY